MKTKNDFGINFNLDCQPDHFFTLGKIKDFLKVFDGEFEVQVSWASTTKGNRIGYLLTIAVANDFNGDWISINLVKNDGQPRVFKSMWAVESVLSDLGFEQYTVYMG